MRRGCGTWTPIGRTASRDCNATVGHVPRRLNRSEAAQCKCVIGFSCHVHIVTCMFSVFSKCCGECVWLYREEEKKSKSKQLKFVTFETKTSHQK